MGNPLEDAGYRLTEPRRRVLDALREAPGPLTAQDVAERASASVASTYRVLALLVELGLVRGPRPPWMTKDEATTSVTAV